MQSFDGLTGARPVRCVGDGLKSRFCGSKESKDVQKNAEILNLNLLFEIIVASS
jgi:hypothetical protein